MSRVPHALCVALALALSASSASALIVQPIASNIAASTSWGLPGSGAAVQADVFHVTNTIAVNSGVTLTVLRGVVIKFDLSRQLVVNGSLRCIGTAADTIVWTSWRDDNNRGGDNNGDGNGTVPAPSDWYGLQFPDASPDFGSALYYCDVRYAGTGQGGALTFQSASDSVVNSVIRRSYYGVDCQGSAAPVFNLVSIEASTLTPFVLDFTATPVLSSLVFSSSNNGYDAFGLRGGTLTGAATLPQRGATVGVNPISNVTYVLFSSITLNSGASLTINPGVVIKPVAGYDITVNSGATLTMNGTAAAGDTITITSIHDDNFGQPGDTNNNGSITAPARGNWGRINFLQGASGSVSRCRLKFGNNGTTSGVVEMINNTIPVSNSLLSDAGHGLALHGTSTPAITNVAINNMSSTPVLMSVSANPTFTGISFLANAITALGIDGEQIAVNSRLRIRNLAGYTNITHYIMNGFLEMLNPAILTIDPGLVIKSQISGGGLIIDGGLISDGKPDSTIVFTSERDDLYGNPPDTNGDGSITTPAQANWSYIRFTATAIDAQCRINNTKILYAANGPFDGWNTSLWITSAAPVIDSVTIFKGIYGIRIDGDGSPTITSCDISNCSSAPIVMSVLSDPVFGNGTNTFSTNGYNAIALISETLSQNATIRYRPEVGPPAYPVFAYLPTGTITVASGVTLTVRPQVVLKPTSSFALFIVNGALNAVGSNNTTGRVIVTSRRDDNPLYGGDTTPTDPTTPQVGDWGNIIFNDISVDPSCVLRNCLFQFGGSGGNDGGTITTVSASPTLARLDFYFNATALTFTGSSQVSVDSTLLFGCTQLPIVSSLISNPVFPHPTQITFANNAYTCLGILGETVAQDVRTRVRPLATFSNVTYALAGNVGVAFGAKWTIDPGVVIKMGRVSLDPIGNTITIDGALSARGKRDSLIVFTSSADDAFGGDLKNDGALTTPAPGGWQYILFNAVSNDTASVLRNCRLRYGGYSGSGALRFVTAGPTIDSTTVTLTSGVGVQVEGASTPIFSNVDIDSASSVPVYMSLVSNPAFTSVRFLGNTYTALGVIPETIAQDILWPIRAVAGRQNMPYLVQGQITMGLGSTATMQPGVIAKFSGGGSILVQRAFIAEGRTPPESLVVFTSYRDDFYGGDTNNDGGATSPTPSDWNWIQLDGTVIDAQVRFRDCVFRYGGSGTTLGVLRVVNASPTVDSCLFSGNAVALSVEGASNPTVHGCSLYGNANFAINNTGNAFCVNAENNWWGAASGPNDASASADLCGLGANAGTGDKVSNNVDYQPYATSGILNPLLGDVSLNGQVLAYDASLVFQQVVGPPFLSPLQLLVADVSGAAGVTAFDGSLILQWVAGVIRAFPAASAHMTRVPPDVLAARELVKRTYGTFQVSLGDPSREGDDWTVPVLVTGAAPIYSLDLRLEGPAAGTLTAVETAGGGAMEQHRAEGGEAAIALGSATPLSAGATVTLRFHPGGGGTFHAPELVFARVNENPPSVSRPAPTLPALSFLGAPHPNPGAGPMSFVLALAAREDGARARVVVHDLAGRAVRVLLDGPLPAGERTVTWDLREAGGGPARPGVYFVTAEAGRFRATRRLVVVR